MEELKQAYRTMGLTEFASKEEVEKRYTTLLRRYRSNAKRTEVESANETSGNDDEFARITEAYRLILAHEDQKFTEAFNEQEYGKYRKMAGQAQKVDHFWRYYKFHTLGAVVLLAFIVYGIVTYIDHREHQKYLASLPPIDLTVSFMGTFMEDSELEGKKQPPPDENGNNRLSQSMINRFPDWKRMESSIVFVPMDDANQYAYLQKAVVTLFSENPDIYIMDRFMFEWIGGQGVLLPLDDKAGLTALNRDQYALKLTTEERPEERVYGYDLEKSQLGVDLPVLRSGLIVGIRANTANPDKAVQFIETYLKTIQ